MIDCISVENMRRSDANTIAALTPSLELMGRAARGVWLAGSWQGRTAIVTGSGNNGGDGFALACILGEQGMDCALFTVGQHLSPDSAHYAERAAELGIPIRPFFPGCLAGADTVVDCLLGTGFQGELRASYREAILEINSSGAAVVSVDINSGMNGDSGTGALIVRSHLTVTIGYVKDGLVSAGAGQHMHRLVCADIGIALDREERKLCTPAEWQALSPAQRESGRFLPCPPWLEMVPVRVR